MIRAQITVPRVLMRAAVCNWDIDWRGQPPAQDVGGGEQIVYNAFPRFIGSPQIILPRQMIGAWRALRAQAQGRVNAWVVPMIDPVSYAVGRGSWQSDWEAYLAGQYVEPRPKVVATAAASAGATTITVDETGAQEPVRIGAYLSYDDWPFIVTARSGSGAAVTLTVAMLRTAIPDEAEIDLYARGVFVSVDDAAGGAQYALNGPMAVQPSFVEWVTR